MALTTTPHTYSILTIGTPSGRPPWCQLVGIPRRWAATRQGSRVRVPTSAVAQLGSCGSSGRVWRLWAARHIPGPTGRPATRSGARASRLQRTLADCTAFGHPGRARTAQAAPVRVYGSLHHGPEGGHRGGHPPAGPVPRERQGRQCGAEAGGGAACRELTQARRELGCNTGSRSGLTSTPKKSSRTCFEKQPQPQGPTYVQRFKLIP